MRNSQTVELRISRILYFIASLFLCINIGISGILLDELASRFHVIAH